MMDLDVSGTLKLPFYNYLLNVVLKKKGVTAPTPGIEPGPSG